MKKRIQAYAKGAEESVYLWPTFFVQGNYGSAKYLSRDAGADWGSTGDPARDALLKSLGEALADKISPPGWNNSWQVTIGATYRWGALSPLDSSHAKAKQGNIAMAEESVRVAGLQFKNGIIDNQKFLDASAELATAKTYYIQARHDFQVAKAELNRAVGQDYFSF